MKIKVGLTVYTPKVCTSFVSRFWGLMGKKNIQEILCFPRCNSIHTFFMREAIDVIMTDKKGHILYAYKNLKPWHLIFPKKQVYYTFEFPINTFDFNQKELQILM